MKRYILWRKYCFRGKTVACRNSKESLKGKGKLPKSCYLFKGKTARGTSRLSSALVLDISVNHTQDKYLENSLLHYYAELDQMSFYDVETDDISRLLLPFFIYTFTSLCICTYHIIMGKHIYDLKF